MPFVAAADLQVHYREWNPPTARTRVDLSPALEMRQFDFSLDSDVGRFAASGALTNSSAITFATPTGSWGTIVAACVCSASSAGDVLFYDNTNIVDQAVATSDTVQVPTGDFDVSLT